MEKTVISAKGISKSYRPFTTIGSRLSAGFLSAKRATQPETRALSDVSFDIERGESVAIIGRNGSGKSTLLEILTGTLAPTRGEASVRGRVSALLELGSGFNPEYTGRENVMLNGLLLGLSRDDIISRFSEIEKFAEIGAAIDRPVKTYSSGMVMRLAFSVQVLCDPEILIIDEALSVGDFFFQQKCLDHLRRLREAGVTLLFVSHDMNTVRDLCPRVLYLRGGQLVFDGPSSKGVSLYYREASDGLGGAPDPTRDPEAMTDRSGQALPDLSLLAEKALWKGPADNAQQGKLMMVAVSGGNGLPTTSFRIGDRLVLEALLSAAADTPLHLSVSLVDKFGACRTVTGSLHLGLPAIPQASGSHLFRLEMQLNIEAGRYGLVVNLGRQTGSNLGEVLDETPALGPLTVTWDYLAETAPFLGQVGLPCHGQFIT